MSNMTTSSVPDKPHQPASFNFAQLSFGQKKVVHRSFQPSWFNHWQFLHYDKSRDAVFCHTCLKGFEQKKMKSIELILLLYVLNSTLIAVAKPYLWLNYTG